jgi:hypothetical protein
VVAAVRSGFTESIHNTFAAGALLCLAAAVAAFFLKDPVRVRAAATEKPEAQSVATAD